ncbi:MAG TPA: SAM-dependent methyltransferase [Methylomirabilota bacterium]
MRRGARVLLGAAVLGAAATACTERPPRAGPDILFVATPEAVAVEMLRLANVTAADVVYDLGSGDGRLVIAAVRDFGARGVGVEIDASLVQDSRERATAAGVADRTRFLWQDLFATDVAAATVVTLYLRDDVNLRLRPKLLGELAPGTRVVSHDFGMGEWQADRTQRIRSESREHRMYLWVIPARVEGTWRWTWPDTGDHVLELSQRFQELTGALRTPTGVAAAVGRVSGDAVRVGVTGAPGGRLSLEGQVAGDVIHGHARAEGVTRAWSARRDPR